MRLIQIFRVYKSKKIKKINKIVENFCKIVYSFIKQKKAINFNKCWTHLLINPSCCEQLRKLTAKLLYNINYDNSSLNFVLVTELRLF